MTDSVAWTGPVAAPSACPPSMRPVGSALLTTLSPFAFHVSPRRSRRRPIVPGEKSGSAGQAFLETGGRFPPQGTPCQRDIGPAPGRVVQGQGLVDDRRQRACQLDDRLGQFEDGVLCLLYTSPSPRDRQKSRMPS